MSFVIATSVQHVLDEMAAGARPVAGGSDLVVSARNGKSALPASIVAIDRLTELAGISVRRDRDSPLGGSGTVRVGALVTHAELMTNAMIVEHFSALADASALVGSPATRHVGTLGGNVMNSSPAMDTGAPLVVLGATVELRSTAGTRHLSVGELWTGPGRTSATPSELCVEILLPLQPERSASAYVRLEYRRAMEIAVVGAAASVTLAEDGTIATVAIALTAVAPTILAVMGVDSAVGMSVGDAIAVVADLASRQCAPISDLRASDTYRRHCIGIMAGRGLSAAARRAGGESIAVPVNRTLGIGAAR